jgi:hypothetical protein
MLDDARSLYADVEAYTNTNIKQKEDLNARLIVFSEREWAVVEKEWDLKVHREVLDTQLEWELKGLTSHEAVLNTREPA